MLKIFLPSYLSLKTYNKQKKYFTDGRRSVGSRISPIDARPKLQRPSERHELCACPDAPTRWWRNEQSLLRLLAEREASLYHVMSPGISRDEQRRHNK